MILILALLLTGLKVDLRGMGGGSGGAEGMTNNLVSSEYAVSAKDVVERFFKIGFRSSWPLPEGSFC